MKVLDLFSGIGGFSLGLERAGMETVAFCEIEEYPRKVLKKHWPDVPIYEDVRNVTKARLESDGITGIDVVTGGFPCQDISVAGKQAGIEGERSGLWGELCRIIGDIRPRYAIVENVTALISGDRGRWFGRVLGDLAEIGYDCEWHCIPASELGAHHHRDRVWIICYPKKLQCNGRDTNRENSECEIPKPRDTDSKNDVANTKGAKCDRIGAKPARSQNGFADGNKVLADTLSSRQPRLSFNSSNQAESGERQAGNVEHVCLGGKWATEPELGRVANGVPFRVDRLKGLGNAVVPQIPEIIGRAIMEIES